MCIGILFKDVYLNDPGSYSYKKRDSIKTLDIEVGNGGKGQGSKGDR